MRPLATNNGRHGSIGRPKEFRSPLHPDVWREQPGRRRRPSGNPSQSRHHPAGNRCSIPMPGDERSLTKALMKAVLLRRRGTRRGRRRYWPDGRGQEDRSGVDRRRRERESRTVFAQNTLKPRRCCRNGRRPRLRSAARRKRSDLSPAPCAAWVRRSTVRALARSSRRYPPSIRSSGTGWRWRISIVRCEFPSHEIGPRNCTCTGRIP